jgi:DNA mismatch repair ATPase MutS
MKTFETSDLSLASYLKACGATICCLEEKDNYYVFHFNEIQQCEKLGELFINDQAMGNINLYENAKRKLLTMIKNPKK